MKFRLAQREVALAGLALLAIAVSLAVTAQTRDAKSTAPQPEGSYTALAGSSGPAAFGRRTACGGVIHPDTVGVAHPTLPCGAPLHHVRRPDGAHAGDRPRPVRARPPIRP